MKTSRHSSNVKANTFHITKNEVVSSSATNLSELLRQEQSIVRLTSNSGDNSQTALSIRGFGDNAASNSLILVDGFPLTNPSLLAPNLNTIAMVNIDHIEIYQGSQGTLWGDQAVGGIVNIITRHPKKFLAGIYLGKASFNTNLYQALIGSHFNNGFFFKGVVFTNRTDNYRHHNHHDMNTISMETGLDYPRGMVSLDAQVNDGTINFPGGLTQAQFDSNPRQANNLTNFMHNKIQLLHLLNKHEINKNWILENRISHQEMQGNGFVFMPFQRTEWENRLSPRLVGMFHHKQLIIGLEEQRSNYTLSNQLARNLASTKQHHFYAQTIVPLSSSFEVTLGGRYAWQDNSAEKILGNPIVSTNRIFVTEQGLTYHPNSHLQFFLRRDGNFRFPKTNEETWTIPDLQTLKAQVGTSTETGMMLETEKQKIQLSVYQLQLYNEIAFDPLQTTLTPFGAFRNFNETIRDGITIAETSQLTSIIFVKSQINYVDARFKSGAYAGNQLPAVPAFTANVDVNYQFTPYWKLSYSALYTGSRYASEDEANIGKHLRGYWLNSISIQYMLHELNISFEVNNLFNEIYPTYVLFDSTTHENTYYPSLGRNYLLTLKANID